MSATLYDKALLNKIKNWVKDGSMKITGPDETRRLFEYTADVTNDKPIELPLVTIRRSPRMLLIKPRKVPMSFDGWRQHEDYADDEHTQPKISLLNGIPITLEYQIDIYTRYFEEAEEYVRNFVYNIINFPKLQIEIPYNDCDIIHNSYIMLSDEVSDNSDIPERLIAGQFTRKTLFVSLDGYLFDYKTKDALQIGDTQVEIHLAMCQKEGEKLDEE